MKKIFIGLSALALIVIVAGIFFNSSSTPAQAQTSRTTTTTPIITQADLEALEQRLATAQGNLKTEILNEIKAIKEALAQSGPAATPITKLEEKKESWEERLKGFWGTGEQKAMLRDFAKDYVLAKKLGALQKSLPNATVSDVAKEYIMARLPKEQDKAQAKDIIGRLSEDDMLLRVAMLELRWKAEWAIKYQLSTAQLRELGRDYGFYAYVRAVIERADHENRLSQVTWAGLKDDFAKKVVYRPVTPPAKAKPAPAKAPKPQAAGQRVVRARADGHDYRVVVDGVRPGDRVQVHIIPPHR
jgi:hypothetical protein